MYTQHRYGSAFDTDGRGNRRVGVGKDAELIGIRFIASQNLPITGFRWVQRGGEVYSLGNGGTFRVTVRNEAAGAPNAILATSNDFSPGNPAGHWERADAQTFSSPYTPSVGQVLWMVLDNVHASESTNYLSINCAYKYDAPLTPRQPAFLDDFALWEYNSGSWVQNLYHTPCVEIIYDSGAAFDGNGYLGIINGSHGSITDTTTMVRERFTVTGGDRTATDIYWKIGRVSGSDLVTVRLETGAGSLIEEGTFADSGTNIPASTPSPTPVNTQGQWCHRQLDTPRTLTNGSTYNVRLSCPATSTYYSTALTGGIFPEGGSPAEYDFASRRFTDGVGQKTTDSGSNWDDLYDFLPQNNPMYFVVLQ